MRSPKIPHYMIGAQIPVELAAKPLDEAQRDLAAWQAECPGPYRITEPCNSPHNEAWRTWAAKKAKKVTAVEVATSPGRRVEPVQPRTFDPGKARGPRSDRKDAAHFAEHLGRKIEEMVGMIPNSDEWQRARSSAHNFRRRCLNRAMADGLPVPELPEIPTVPLEISRQGQHPKAVA